MANEFRWTVPANHPAFAGHFPGNPIVPGVVLLDRALLLAATLAGHDGSGWQVAQAKFFSPVGPGETLVFMLQPKGNGFAFSIGGHGREVAAGNLTPPAP